MLHMATGSERDATSVLDVGELDRVFGRIEERERRRSVEHAAQLTDLITLDRITRDAGMELMTVAHIAFALNSSERRAESLLADAIFLDGLGALAVMAEGLLTIEQAAVVIDLLRPVDDELTTVLWHKLAERLAEDRILGVVRPPSRLRELLRRWVIAADPEGYEQRRRTSVQAEADVQCWQRDDGLVDLVGRALSAADAQACMDRIEQLAQPTGPDDTRSAGERRRQVMIDLLTGRLILPLDQTAASGSDAAAVGVVGCCPPGSPAPCGAEVFVHVPLPTAEAVAADVATTDEAEVVAGFRCEPALEPAELVGYGAIDRGALADLLLANPVLRRVWVDNNGVPVAVDDQTWQPGRGDLERLRRILRDLAHGPPPTRFTPSILTITAPGCQVRARRTLLTPSRGCSRGHMSVTLARTCRTDGRSASCEPAPHGASGQAVDAAPVAASPPRAMSTMTSPGLTDRPAHARWDRSAVGTTGSSSSAGSSTATLTAASAGPARPDAAGPTPASIPGLPRGARARRSPARCRQVSTRSQPASGNSLSASDPPPDPRQPEHSAADEFGSKPECVVDNSGHSHLL